MFNIPNTLTILRLLFAVALPIVFLVFAHPYADWIALTLFVLVSVTDYLDGYLARLRNQTSKLGAMLDPIADKAMVVIALMALVGLYDMNGLIAIPATFIIFREIFVSGLREYLGADAGKLAVTQLAKWKTTVQMVAITALLMVGVFEHYFGMRSIGMGADITAQVLDGSIEDTQGLIPLYYGFLITWYGGLALLWLAAGLTVLTGYDYLRKAWMFLQD